MQLKRIKKYYDFPVNYANKSFDQSYYYYLRPILINSMKFEFKKNI